MVTGTQSHVKGRQWAGEVRGAGVGGNHDRPYTPSPHVRELSRAGGAIVGRGGDSLLCRQNMDRKQETRGQLA